MLRTTLRYVPKAVVGPNNTVRYVIFDNVINKTIFKGSPDKAQRAFDYWTLHNSNYEFCEKQQHPFFDCLV